MLNTSSPITIESLVANNQMEEAFKQLEGFLSNLNEKYRNDITSLKGQLSANNDRKASISNDQFTMQQNRIRSSFLYLLDSIRSDLQDQFVLFRPSSNIQNENNIENYVFSRSNGKYEIIRLLREGSNMVNFHAKDIPTERDVVIKVHKLNYLYGDKNKKNSRFI